MTENIIGDFANFKIFKRILLISVASLLSNSDLILEILSSVHGVIINESSHGFDKYFWNGLKAWLIFS